MEVSLRRILPDLVLWISRHGALGVQIFFVISGFVIAHSLRRTEMTVPAVVNFIVRRQLRLDPPYWITLLLVLAVGAVELKIPGLVKKPLPEASTALANAFYLQNIAHLDQMLGVAWTLCLEVQFYLALIVMLFLGGRAGRRIGNEPSRVSLWSVIACGLLSMSLSGLQGVCFDSFLPYWSYFAAGVICKWRLEQKVSRLTFWSFMVALALTAGWLGKPSMYMGLATVLALYFAGCTGRLSSWLNQRWIQYLGRISYSLYLVHLPVIFLIMRGGYKLTHENPWAALGWYLLALSGSMVAAHFLHAVVERPSMRLAARLKRKPEVPGQKAGGLLDVIGCASDFPKGERVF